MTPNKNATSLLYINVISKNRDYHFFEEILALNNPTIMTLGIKFRVKKIMF